MQCQHTIGRRSLLVVLFAVLVALPPSPAAGATEYDGKYTGVIRCDALPNQLPLRTNFSLTITDGQVRYERVVLGTPAQTLV